MAISLSPYWQLSGRTGEGRYWLAKILDRFPGPSPERAGALVYEGFLASWQGETSGALTRLEEGVRMAAELGEATICAWGSGYLVMACLFAGRYAEAEAARSTAIERVHAINDAGLLVSLDVALAYQQLLAGNAEECVARCAEGIQRLGVGSRERWRQSYLHMLTGTGLLLQGKHEASAEAFGLALEMKHEIGDTMGTAYALEGTAWLAAAQQRYARTAWLLGAADPLWELVGSRLSRNTIMEGFHARAEQAASNGLGEEHYATLYRRGGSHPLDQIITLAVSGADELRAGPDAPCGAKHPPGPLTSREQEIAVLVADGLSNREIAERLVISKRTVDRHLEHILPKLGATSRVQIANWVRSPSG
jgi:non-specific serine/threonine protein kinase